MNVSADNSAGPYKPKKGMMQNALREIAFSIFVRKSLVLIIFGAVFAFTLLVALVLPPVYRSTANFSLTIPVNFDPLESRTVYDYKNKFERELNKQKELIMSNRVLAKVIHDMKLGDGEVSSTLERIRARLDVIPPKGETFEGTTSFLLNYEDRNPERTAAFARSIARSYIQAYRELEKERADYSYGFFRQQTEELFTKMTEKEAVLREYERKKAVQLIEILNLEPGASTNQEVGPMALLTRFMGEYLALQEELAAIHSTIEKTEKAKNTGSIPVILPEMEVAGRAITVFKRKVAQLQIQLNEMKPRFQEDYELLKQVESELNLNVHSLRGELDRSLQATRIQASTLERRIKEVEGTIEGLKAHITSTAHERSIYQQIKQDYELAKASYVQASQQMEQARLSQALSKDKQNVILVDEPVVPSKPVKPNRPLVVVLGLMAGVFLGVAVALTLDFFDHSIRKNEDIEHHLEVPVLGSIPQLSKL
jgi:uncharacterized protein involved in exopolysaccharide biosynthesis